MSVHMSLVSYDPYFYCVPILSYIFCHSIENLVPHSLPYTPHCTPISPHKSRNLLTNRNRSFVNLPRTLSDGLGLLASRTLRQKHVHTVSMYFCIQTCTAVLCTAQEC